jgi:hypothetical protein
MDPSVATADLMPAQEQGYDQCLLMNHVQDQNKESREESGMEFAQSNLNLTTSSL